MSLKKSRLAFCKLHLTRTFRDRGLRKASVKGQSGCFDFVLEEFVDDFTLAGSLSSTSNIITPYHHHPFVIVGQRLRITSS